MSEIPTPRTDEAEHESIKAYQIEREAGWPPFPCDGYDFARTLERELTAATERAEKAEADAARWQHNAGSAVTVAIERIQTQRDQWREVAGRLVNADTELEASEALAAYDALIAQENGGTK